MKRSACFFGILGAVTAVLVACARPAAAQGGGGGGGGGGGVNRPPAPAGAPGAAPGVTPAAPAPTPAANPAPTPPPAGGNAAAPAATPTPAAAPTTSPAVEAADAARSILGVTLSTSGTDRDTLGPLVSSVVKGGPADKGGVDPGNRLSEVNGASLRIDPVTRRQSMDDVGHRLIQVLHSILPGDSVTLRLYGGGRYRTITLQTAHPNAPPVDPHAPQAALNTLIYEIGNARGQVHLLTEQDGILVPLDTLMWVESQLGVMERRLRAVQIAQPEPAPELNVGDTVPGLRFITVVDQLTDYFGADSKGGLLVIQSDSSWAPIQKGDVILRVDGQRATLDRLRVAANPQRQTQVDLMRKGRYLMITLHRPETPGGPGQPIPTR